MLQTIKWLSQKIASCIIKSCKKNKIFIELYILKEDGYGFGISDSNTATQLWLEITKEWLFSRELLKN